MVPRVPIAPDFTAPAVLDACRRLGIRLLVRFGSTVPGGLAPHPDSDVDVGVVFRPGAARVSAHRLHHELSDTMPEVELDVVNLSEADPLLRWEVMRAGVPVFGDELDFLEYRAFAFRDFTDADGLRAVEAVLFQRKLSWLEEGGRAQA